MDTFYIIQACIRPLQGFDLKHKLLSAKLISCCNIR